MMLYLTQTAEYNPINRVRQSAGQASGRHSSTSIASEHLTGRAEARFWGIIRLKIGNECLGIIEGRKAA